MSCWPSPGQADRSAAERFRLRSPIFQSQPIRNPYQFKNLQPKWIRSVKIWSRLPALPAQPRARAKSRLACCYPTVPAPEAAQRRMMGFVPQLSTPTYAPAAGVPGPTRPHYSDPSHVPVIRVK